MPEEALLGYFLTGGTALFFSHTCLRILPLDNLNAFWGISQLAFLSAFFSQTISPSRTFPVLRPILKASIVQIPLQSFKGICMQHYTKSCPFFLAMAGVNPYPSQGFQSLRCYIVEGFFSQCRWQGSPLLPLNASYSSIQSQSLPGCARWARR